MSLDPQSDVPQQLVSWLRQVVGNVADIEALPGDVSNRSYYRVRRRGEGSAIAVHYPESLRDSYRTYLRSSELLRTAGVRVPVIFETEPAGRAMLIEDFGDRALFDVSPKSAESARLYGDAIDIARRISHLDPRAVAELNRPLGTAHLLRELRQTFRLFFAPRLGNAPLSERLWSTLEELCSAIGREPPVPCHRDFMARNLMVLEGGRLGVIDHQDLRMGPPLYDLASLLTDSVRLEEPRRLAFESDAMQSDPLAFARCATQRCLKIIGTFVAFAERGYDRHLSLVPVSLERGLRLLAGLPEGREVAAELGRRNLLAV